MDETLTKPIKPASPEFASQLFRRVTENFFPPELMYRVLPELFHFPVPVADENPLLPSEETLRRLKEIGCAVMWMPSGITAQAIHHVTNNPASDWDELFYSTNGYSGERFFTMETTGHVGHYRVFSLEPLPEFSGINYLDQTWAAIKLAESFGVRTELINDAREELASKEKEIVDFLDHDKSQKASRSLSRLQANQKFAPNFAQQTLYQATYQRVNSVRRSENEMAWTNSLSDDNRFLIASGCFDDEGVCVFITARTNCSTRNLSRFFSCDVADLT